MALYPDYYVVDFCSGSGMLGLALKLALCGCVRTVAYVEREAYAAGTLVARMEDAALDRAPIWDDVDTTTSPEFLGYVRRFAPLALCAGYPCQPFSCAGKRLGEADPRHLWPAIDRFIGAAKPALVFLENVPGHLRLGFGAVRRNLQTRGYAVEAGLFSAAEVGANHERRRLFILAVANSRHRQFSLSGPVQNSRGWIECAGADMGHAENKRGSWRGWISERPGTKRQRASESDRSGPPLADGDSLQCDACGFGDAAICAEQPSPPQLQSGTTGLPLFAPAPDDSRAWEQTLSQRPEVKPGIHRVFDGMANRLDSDRLRLTGGGVVPLAAAYAFLSLAAVHAYKRGV